MIWDVAVPAPGLVEEGRAALRAGDAATARAAFDRAFAEAGGGAALEGLAQAAYLDLDFPTAISTWEHAYALHRAAGDDLGAIRVARMLSYLHMTVGGDRAVSSGWLARAQTLLGGVEVGSEQGWVDLTGGLFEPDRTVKEARFRAALDVARVTGDVELELVALAYLGASLVHGDRVEEGMMLLDEALAALAGGEVDDFFTLEEVFCQLFSACEHAHDVARADQWIRVGDAIAAQRRLPAVSAFCRTHYGGVLTAAGRWTEADTALSDAVGLWGLSERSGLRQGALVRLADLRIRQGRIDEAIQLLDGIDPGAEPEAARPQAAVHLARGEVERAVDLLERAVAEVDPASSSAAPLLALLVDAHLAAGRADDAATIAAQLAECAAQHPHHDYLQAAAALAQGRVCVASGTGDPRSCLRAALAGFARAGLPMELARSRLELASSMAEERPEVALAEARAALEVFEQLRAARDADAAAAVLRALGVRPTTSRRADGVLTRREAEVLELIGTGLSNPEIAERLYISRKTVEHHVGNVLAKLGLRSRAEAAAHAARQQPGTK